MGNKKKILLTALLLGLSAGIASAGTNDLLKMDVKKSSASDAVDVTFYTTGGSTNSVVTRKGDNRYVVLLPNVSGSASVTPNIGGVKDLITNIDVKNVDDGIGGYTKVTFTTSKPLKIQTAMKKTAPLTKAQEEYKNLIAQNKNTKPQPKANAAAPKPVSVAAKQPAKPAQTKQEVKDVSKVSAQQTPATKTVKIAQAPKVEQKSQTAAFKPKTVVEKKANSGVNNVVNQTAPVQAQESKPEVKITEKPQSDKKVQTTASAAKTQTKQTVKDISKNGMNFNSLLTILLSVLGGIFALTMLVKLFSRKNAKIEHKESYMSVDNSSMKQDKYEEISNNKNLTWREKYNKYNELNEKKASSTGGLTYITNTSASKKIIINQKPVYKVNTIKTDDNAPALDLLPKQQRESNEQKQSKLVSKIAAKTSLEKKNKELIKDELRARISQMEHSLKQTPTLNSPSEYKKDIYAESDTISEKLSDIKLKTFAKSSLGESHRMLIGAEKVSAETAKEGRFVKLKNSALNISTRKSASSKINSTDYYKNYGEMNMDKKDNYAVSSLNEYFSILDSEEKATEYFSKPAPVVDGKVSNPISSSRKAPAVGSLNGMIIRSSYNIDSNRGFYIVDMDGASALIGKINDNVFILKKFNEVIDRSLQVRLDSGSVYMVKAGRYKCLVDVSKDRMGTLVEI